jgi:hypothetical protein
MGFSRETAYAYQLSESDEITKKRRKAPAFRRGDISRALAVAFALQK